MGIYLMVAAALSLASIAVVAFAMRSLAQARAEFQGRLRDAALRRTQVLLLAAVCVGATAANVVAYAATGVLQGPQARALVLKPALALSGFGPHLGK